jgi:uncharacterized membrane protein YtjA (UPF0391 family)
LSDLPHNCYRGIPQGFEPNVPDGSKSFINRIVYATDGYVPIQLEEVLYALLGGGFFIIAIVAAVFGFGGIAAGAVSIAKILFFIFLVLFLVSLLAGMLRRG